MDSNLPTFQDILSSAERIKGKAVHTPLLEQPFLNEMVGGRLLIKAENLQRTGSFKFRGAYNRISRIEAKDRKNGVVAYSSGNHAQGVAAAAQLFDITATIVMPRDAPKIKIENTKFYGADIVFYERHQPENRALFAEKIVEETGATLVRPFDDRWLLAGQGTVGLEMVEQAKQMNAPLDMVIVPCGGGGLVSGIAIAMAELSSATEIFAVEPEEFDDTYRSLKSGRIESIDPNVTSICDALLSATPGHMTMAICSKLLNGVLTINDKQAEQAMHHAFSRLKLVTEPGGAAALAAVLSGKIDVYGKTVGIVCSGGNVDEDVFQHALAIG